MRFKVAGILFTLVLNVDRAGAGLDILCEGSVDEVERTRNVFLG